MVGQAAAWWEAEVRNGRQSEYIIPLMVNCMWYRGMAKVIDGGVGFAL